MIDAVMNVSRSDAVTEVPSVPVVADGPECQPAGARRTAGPVHDLRRGDSKEDKAHAAHTDHRR